MHLHIRKNKHANTADSGKPVRSHDVKYSIKWWSFAGYKSYKKTSTELVSWPWKGPCKSETYRFSFLSHIVNLTLAPPLLNQYLTSVPFEKYKPRDFSCI